VLLTKDGTLGRVALFDGGHACINQSVALLRPRSDAVVPELLVELLRATPYNQAMLFDAGGTTIKHLYVTRVRKLRVALPSLGEQALALAEIRRLRAASVEQEELLVRSIALLQERRRALVTAAVTGKLDVSKGAA
jgi:type I restriction enzyme S subunit